MNKIDYLLKHGITKSDLELAEKHGLTIESLALQFELYERGMPIIRIYKPCTPSDGIKSIDESKTSYYYKLWEAAAAGGRLMKFVPSSGAATRMFKDFHSVLLENKIITREIISSSTHRKEYASIVKTISELKKFAFYSDLEKIMAVNNLTADVLIDAGDYTKIIEHLLYSDELNYSCLPKGLVKFHKYNNGSKTAFEEQLNESIRYTLNSNGTARIHFTIAHEFEEEIKAHINSAVEEYAESGIHLNVEYSFQKKSTDVIAVNHDNNVFRDKAGQLVFRPAGHGALLENLNDLKSDIVFIKNIDNVVHKFYSDENDKYKKLLCGYLIELQTEIFNYLHRLERDVDSSLIDELINYLPEKLSIQIPENFNEQEKKEQAEFFFNKLNRPIRVCGMVKNEDEPGGGPFWVKDEKGNISLQIVESAQVNKNSADQLNHFKNATHFNPVDIVCGLQDYQGNNFNLMDFRDSETGIIITKHKNGKELKAIELPGLWNGGMAYWNTIFVEVPIITFNPVKEVNDLLKRTHMEPGSK